MTSTSNLIKQLKSAYMWSTLIVRENQTRNILGLEETPDIVFTNGEFKSPKENALATAKKMHKRVFQFSELPINHVITNNTHDIKILLQSGFKEVH